MTSKTSKILSDEHKNILTVIDALLKEADAIEDGKIIDEDFFERAIDFIRNYADKFHHAKEEDILFVEFNNNATENCCNPIEQMLHEHDEGRGFVKNMEEGVSAGDKDKVVENAKSYAYLLQEHIFKEDNVMYPMADEVLGDKEQEMLKQFLKIEDGKKKETEKYLDFTKEAAKR